MNTTTKHPRARTLRNRQRRLYANLRRIDACNLSTRTVPVGRLVVLQGFHNGRIVYTSKPLRPGVYLARVRYRWLKRASRTYHANN